MSDDRDPYVADDSVVVVLCQRLDEPGYPVNGSTIERCRCGREVWVAPSTYDRAPIAVRIDFVCNRCEPTTDYGRGYRHALRVAYLLAGGVSDGSEPSWYQIERQTPP